MEEERAYIEWLKGQKSEETKPAVEMVSCLSWMFRIHVAIITFTAVWPTNKAEGQFC